MYIVFSKFHYLEILKIQYLDLFYSTYLLYIYLWISKADLLNFADDHTISAAENSIEKLISTLQQDSQAAIDWFKIMKSLKILTNFKPLLLRKIVEYKRFLCSSYQQPNY